MSYQLESMFEPPGLDPSEFHDRVDRLLHSESTRLRRLWNYYRNPMLPALARPQDAGSDRPYRQAQEWGLPSRITGVRSGADTSLAQSIDEIARKEVVIENDIAWRIDTLVDYLFGKPPVITAANPSIEALLQLILTHNGGIVFLQQVALIGAVYGFVDVLVKFDASRLTPDGAGPSARTPDDSARASVLPNAESVSREPGHPTREAQHADLARLAQCIRLEIVEPTRALPFLDPTDYRDVLAYAQVYSMPASRNAARPVRSKSWLERLFPALADTRSCAPRLNEQMTVVELITPTRWQRYEEERLVASGANSLGELPLVHIQNSAMPFEYAGGSDVEPLLALQDELNTRLSDRAHRITMQSFKMYLGVGIENFGEMPVAPGRMWMTENAEARVQEFGGDAQSPSEDAHIREIREAMDKTSSVTPIAAGAIKNRIGRLTSAAALRVTLLALLAKTERKRTLYGDGLKKIFELSLAWLDRAGLFSTTPQQRRIELSWPSPIPNDESDRLADAHSKIHLGVPRDTVLRELGYAAT